MNLTTRNGTEFEIDDDRPDLARHQWGLHEGRVCRYEGTGTGLRRVGDGQRRIWLHHEVLGSTPRRGVHIDHIDTNPLNNRRSNLRETTPSQNAQNRPAVTRTGRIRGVSWNRAHSKWWARATINYQTFNVGYFDTQEAAAEAVAAWRREHMTHSTQDVA
jgi:HNH endonuclease/AP2 domain